MRNRVLALLLMVFVPIAPAICEGSAPEPEAAVPSCHAHAAATPGADDLGADDDAQCCAACDAYVSGKLSSEAPLQLALLVAPSQPQLRLLAWSSRASHAHPPPLDSSSAYLRQSSPLRI